MKELAELPDDLEALRRLALKQQDEIVRLEHNIRVLTQMVFGRSSERRVPEPPVPTRQGNLFLQEIAAEAARLSAQHRAPAGVSEIDPPRDKKGRRNGFPGHLPQVRTVCEFSSEERSCSCGGELRKIGEEVARELERVETVVVHEIARKKYACPKCKDRVVTAPWRGRVIEKGLLGPGFLAHLISEHFDCHMPYYRLEGKYKAEGLDLSRSVLCDSVARCAELLEPIAEVLRQEVLASEIINTDDTKVILAKSAAGKSREARVWVYLNQNGRHWYDFTESRKRDGPARVFRGFKGYIQADAYPGKTQLFLPDGATEVGCWAHLRRKFLEAEATERELSRAAVDQIRDLFSIEHAAAELPASARQTLRQEQSKLLLDGFEKWMKTALTQVLPQRPLAKAIGYARNHWVALCRFLEDGRLELTNNSAERALRPIAVGRKNWLFFERERGGRTATTLMSLLMTAKAAGVNAGDYFRDVLLRISEPGLSARDLTPHASKLRFEPEVRSWRNEILEKLNGNR